MTLAEYQQNIASLATRVTERAVDAAIVPAASGLLANIKNRTINDGKGSAGNKIGTYSNKPAYYTRAQFVKKGAFKPVGRNGFKGERLVRSKNYTAVRQKNGRERLVRDKTYKVVKKTPKSMFIEDGYKGLRQVQGRRTDIVNLEYSGDTMLAYQMAKAPVGVQLGFTREKASKIRKGLELKYGPVFSATKQEITLYGNEVTKQIEILTRQILTQ